MRGQHSHQPANHSSPEDGHGVAEDDEAVVEQELVGAALAVVRDHVRRVVQEVTDGEADQAVAGHRVAPLQIRHYVRGPATWKHRQWSSDRYLQIINI